MIAYVTSIGEKTTEICCQQLRRYGFFVVLLNKKEEWIDKYKRFINLADEDCLRIDADIIPNHKVKFIEVDSKDALMIQHKLFDFYRNDVIIGGAVFYRRKALKIIKKNIGGLNRDRPETSAWRLNELVKDTVTSDLVVGMHGFFQDKETMERAEKNKMARDQIGYYDFNLAFKLMKL